MDETSEWCNSFVLVPKANVKVQLSLNPARLNKVLILIKYLTLIDASLGYHNLKLDEQSCYVTTFSCSFGRYRNIRLHLGSTHQ